MSAYEPSCSRITRLDAGGEARWDAFVDSRPDGNFFQRAGWKRAIEQGFGQECHFLQVEAGGVLQGVLPLVHVRSRLFGDALVSTGFCVGGGPLAVDASTIDLLIAHAEALAVELRVERLELRVPAPQREGWFNRTGLYLDFGRPLDPDPDADFRRLRGKQRNMVRKGQKAGLISRIESGIDRFYDVYAASVRHLGTPVFAKRYFQALQQAFEGECDVVTVELDGRAVASVLNFYYRGTVMAYYAGSLPAERRLGANDVMYHDLLRHAVLDRGARRFDFGRSKVGTGNCDFKRHWGCEETPLAYGFWMTDGREPPEINPLNPKYELMIRAWQRLPLWATRTIGPPIARQLG